MQQRLFLADGDEVAAARSDEDVVGDERRHRGKAAAVAVEQADGRPQPGERDEARDDQQQRRQDPSRPPLVEARQGERPRLPLGDDQAGDEIAADDEEDVDADEAAADRIHAGVPEDDRRDRNRPQPVDFPATQHPTASPAGASRRPAPWRAPGETALRLAACGRAKRSARRSLRDWYREDGGIVKRAAGAIRVWTNRAQGRSGPCEREAPAISSRRTTARPITRSSATAGVPHRPRG